MHDFKIEKLESHMMDEFKSLLNIFYEVFENNGELPSDDYLNRLLSMPGFNVFVIMLDGKVVGGLTAYVLQGYYAIEPIAYIYDVGVSSQNQGQGLGKALISYVQQYFKSNGFVEMYVEAEGDDIEALSFYRRTNASREMHAVHFSYDLL